jgi:VCBS repeat-containing protein
MTKARDLANAASAFDVVTATELEYIDGVTSAVQTQIDTKAPTSTTVTLTGTQTLTNKTLTTPIANSPVLIGPEERITVSATAATGTVNFDALTQGLLYYTTNASGNWTLNVRGDGSNTLNSVLAIGDSITVSFLVTNGGTAYRHTAMTIDGTSVTPKWSGGTAPAAGNASSIDAYAFTIIKTASATYTVLGAGPIKYA